ncbi:FAD binding domain-containing protein [Chloroflexota bacterium]
MPQVLHPFEYYEPITSEEAVRILSKYGDKSKALAGGVDLIARMRQRQIKPECVVNIKQLPGLNYIQHDETKSLRIGALSTLRSIELSPIIKQDYIALYEAVHQITSVQVKTMGTMIGNLCVASPASDVAPALIVLGAKCQIISLAPKRTIYIENFFTGVNQTILQPDEIVTDVLLPSRPKGSGSAFMNLVRTAGDIAKVNVAVYLLVDNNTCKEAKIALGAVAPTVIRARKAEEILKGQRLTPEIIKKAATSATEGTKPITDIRSTSEYRKETTEVLVRRTIVKALERAKVS